MPIESIINIFTFLALLFLTVKVRGLAKKNPEQETLWHFYHGFACGVFYFFIHSLGGTVAHDPSLVAVFGVIGRIFALLAIMFFTRISFIFFRAKRLERVYTSIMLSLIMISGGMASAGLERVEEIGERPDNLLTSQSVSIVGIALAASLLIAALSYGYSAIIAKKRKEIFIRSLLLSIGCSLFFLSSVLNYLLIDLIPDARIYAVILGIPAATSFILGVFWRS